MRNFQTFFVLVSAILVGCGSSANANAGATADSGTAADTAAADTAATGADAAAGADSGGTTASDTTGSDVAASGGGDAAASDAGTGSASDAAAGGGAGITVTQGANSFTMETGSTVTMRYLTSKNAKLVPKDAADTDKIIGFSLIASGPKAAGEGIHIEVKFRLPSGGMDEKLVSDLRGKPLVVPDGGEQFSVMPMYMQTANQTGLGGSVDTHFAINLTSAGVPLKGSFKSVGNASNTSTTVTVDLP